MASASTTLKLNWKKELNSDEREVCHVQAALFELCQNRLQCDAFDFVYKFMHSNIAADMDCGELEYYDVDPLELLNTLPITLLLQPMTGKKSTAALHWVGYFYRYWAWLGTPSKQIIQVVPVENAYAAYGSLHTLDVREAIGMFVERVNETGNGFVS